MNIPENFKINLNQNLWGLLLTFTALGASEYFNLRALFWLSFIASAVMLTSIIFTTTAYTWRYFQKKLTG